MDWNGLYCQNDYTTQGNLQIQYNPYQLPVAIFTKLEQKNVKICMETQRPQIAKAILRNKNGAGGIRILDFRQYYKGTAIKTI